MNLYPEPRSMSGQPWRQSEDDYLIKFYGKVTIEEIAKITGRSRNAVKTRARVLGVAKPRDPSQECKPRPVKRKRNRKFPKHLRDSFKHFICDVVEDNPEVQVAMQERWGSRC